MVERLPEPVAGLVNVEPKQVSRLPAGVKRYHKCLGPQQLPRPASLPILQHSCTLHCSAKLPLLRPRARPAPLPTPLLHQQPATRVAPHPSIDPNCPLDHDLVTTSASLRDLMDPHAATTRLSLVVVDGQKFLGRCSTRRRCKLPRVSRTLIHHFFEPMDNNTTQSPQPPHHPAASGKQETCDPPPTPSYTYNSWNLHGTRIAVRHRTEAHIHGVGTVSFKPVPANTSMSESQRVGLWMHAYLRGEHTIALAHTSTSTAAVVRVEYIRVVDLVDARGDVVRPYMCRLAAVLAWIAGLRGVADAVYCVEISGGGGGLDLTGCLYRLEEAGGPVSAAGSSSFEDKLAQLEF